MPEMQLYWVLWPEYPRGYDDLPRPGQFVFEHNDSDLLAGFVAEVDYNNKRSLLCLFKSADLNLPSSEIIRENMPDEEVYGRLTVALKANPTMKHEWIKAVYSASTNDSN